MVRSVTGFWDKPISALDGDIGKLHDIYFDDRTWQIRCFVVELGFWLFGKQVLVAPSAVTPFDGAGLRVELTKKEIQASPQDTTLQPRELETAEAARDAYARYANAGGNWLSMPNSILMPLCWSQPSAAGGDPHLHSCRALCGCQLAGANGETGVIADLLIDDAAWAVRFLVGQPADEPRTGQVLLWPHLVKEFDLPAGRVLMHINQRGLRQRPLFDPARHLDRPYADMLAQLSGQS
jgi:hypothetical protein